MPSSPPVSRGAVRIWGGEIWERHFAWLVGWFFTIRHGLWQRQLLLPDGKKLLTVLLIWFPVPAATEAPGIRPQDRGCDLCRLFQESPNPRYLPCPPEERPCAPEPHPKGTPPLLAQDITHLPSLLSPLPLDRCHLASPKEIKCRRHPIPSM